MKNRISPLTLNPIGAARTPYKEKFAVPRQPGLAPHAEAVLSFFPPYNCKDAFDGIESFSHLFVIFVFDRALNEGFKAKVRPPRLGGNERVGVFASRSPFRPAHLGLSVVKLLGVDYDERDGISLRVAGADLVDGTPIVDIKPYIPFVDSIPDARGGFAAEKPELYKVSFEPEVLKALEPLGSAALLAIEETLAQDPRPAYKGDLDEKIYTAALYGFDISFKHTGDGIRVTGARKLGDEYV